MTAVQELTKVFRAEHRILSHVSDRDGLAIMVETRPDDAADRILSARKAALDAGLDLLTRAATARERRA